MVIVEVNWCSTVAFHMSTEATRCFVGRILGSTLFVGPLSGNTPLEGMTGSALEALGGWLGRLFNPDMLYTGTTPLTFAELLSVALTVWWTSTGKFWVTA